MGAHQGAPLGSMIYSAGQQNFLRMAQAQLSGKPTGNVRAYIDDISVQGHINDIEDTSVLWFNNHPKSG